MKSGDAVADDILRREVERQVHLTISGRVDQARRRTVGVGRVHGEDQFIGVRCAGIARIAHQAHLAGSAQHVQRRRSGELVSAGAVHRRPLLEDDAAVPLGEHVFEAGAGPGHREVHSAVACRDGGPPAKSSCLPERRRGDSGGQRRAVGEDDSFAHGG